MTIVHLFKCKTKKAYGKEIVGKGLLKKLKKNLRGRNFGDQSVNGKPPGEAKCHWYEYLYIQVQHQFDNTDGPAPLLIQTKLHEILKITCVTFPYLIYRHNFADPKVQQSSFCRSWKWTVFCWNKSLEISCRFCAKRHNILKKFKESKLSFSLLKHILLLSVDAYNLIYLHF